MSGFEAAIGFGAAVLGIASAGISVATTLVRFSDSYSGSAEKVEDLSSRVSLTATVVTTVGNTIETHKIYFKEDNFKGVWGRVIDRCQTDYGNLEQALNKARGEVKDLASDRDRKVRKMTPWRKLVWALGGDERMKDLQSSLEESKIRRILTEAETNDLAELKQKIRRLYGYLLEEKLLSDRSVLSSPEQEGKAGKKVEDEVVVLAEYLGGESTCEKRLVEPESDMVDRHPIETNKVEWVKDIAGSSRSWPLPLPQPDHEKAQEGKCRLHEPPATLEPFYEAWAIMDHKTSLRIKTFQLFGLKLKIKEQNLTDLYTYCAIAATQSELKNAITQLHRRIPYTNPPSTLQQITTVSARCANTVTEIILHRENATKYSCPPRSWAIEVLAPWSRLPSATSAFQTITKSNYPGYLLILCALGDESEKCTISVPNLNPLLEEEKFIPAGAKGRFRESHEFDASPPVIQHRRCVEQEDSVDKRVQPKMRQSARRTNHSVHGIEIMDVSQKAAETAVNDFLATFSSLYDDVPEGERTKVLDSTPVREQVDESDSESDSASEDYEGGRARRA